MKHGSEFLVKHKKERKINQLLERDEYVDKHCEFEIKDNIRVEKEYDEYHTKLKHVYANRESRKRETH